MTEIISGSEFARLCGVSRNAISKQAFNGKLNKTENGKYDLSDPDNFDYFEKKRALKIEKEKQHPAKKTTPKKKTSKLKVENIGGQKKTTDFDTPPGNSIFSAASRREYEIEKIKYEVLLKKVQYEKEMKSIITREEIQHIWNKIYKSATYFGDFGQRYAPVWAAALGISEHDKIDFLQKQIDEATELFMADFTETITGEI